MRWSDQIRRWRNMGFYSLLVLALHGFVISQTATQAQTATAKPPKKAVGSSKAPTAKAAHHFTKHATAKRTISRASGKKGKTSRSKKTARKRGQQAIDPARARQIQTALIREHYIQGAPSGVWDSATQAAMRRYQADQGWQSKTTPDSRALIKLGLGPSHDHLLNPESAMTMPAAAAPAAADPKAESKPTPPDNNLLQQ